MDDENKELINEVVEDPDWITEDDKKKDFIGEVYLSTDGKNTVFIRADTAESRKKGLEWAKVVYEALLKRYGTKQGQAVKEYGNNKEDLGKCNKCGAPNRKSMKGKVYCSDKCWLNEDYGN